MLWASQSLSYKMISNTTMTSEPRVMGGGNFIFWSVYMSVIDLDLWQNNWLKLSQCKTTTTGFPILFFKLS